MYKEIDKRKLEKEELHLVKEVLKALPLIITEKIREITEGKITKEEAKKI